MAGSASSSSCSASESGAPPEPKAKVAHSECPTHVTVSSLPVSYAHSKACRCCLCNSLSTDESPFEDPNPETQNRRPWAKYRRMKLADGTWRVPEGKCCLPCFNTFRALGPLVAKTRPFSGRYLLSLALLPHGTVQSSLVPITFLT